MSIMTLKKRFAGGLGQAILIGMIVVLGIGMVIMFSGYSGRNQLNGGGGAAEASGDKGETIATVNGKPITRDQLESTYKLLDNRSAPMPPSMGSR